MSGLDPILSYTRMRVTQCVVRCKIYRFILSYSQITYLDFSITLIVQCMKMWLVEFQFLGIKSNVNELLFTFVFKDKIQIFDY